MNRRVLSWLFLALLPLVPASAQVEDPAREVGIDQNLGASLPLAAEFTNARGETISLGELFGERPVVLALVYYECPMLCNLVLNGLVRALKVLRLDAGEDYELVAISIDPLEPPEVAAEKRAGYLARYDRDGAEAGFHFLVGEEAQIRSVAEVVGFRYRYDERTGEYAHGAGAYVVTPEGTLARYFYGYDYSPRDLRLALVEASEGRLGSFVDEMLLLCFHYDPTVGRYGLAIQRVLRGAGILTLVVLAGSIFLWSRRSSRAESTPRADAPAEDSLEEGSR